MSLLKNESITIERRSGDIFVKGKVSKGVSSTFMAKASIQQLNSFQLMQLPELDRTKDVLNILSSFAFKLNDIITRNSTGLKYKIIKLQDFSSFRRIGYFNAISISLDQ